jgi:hypothetical protein
MRWLCLLRLAGLPRRQSRIDDFVIGGPRFEPVALAVQLQDMDMMREAIEQRNSARAEPKCPVLVEVVGQISLERRIADAKFILGSRRVPGIRRLKRCRSFVHKRHFGKKPSLPSSIQREFRRYRSSILSCWIRVSGCQEVRYWNRTSNWF